MNTKNIGDDGEEKAVEYLKENGYEIVDRNYRLRTGEIDIIATKDDFLVFVEVKYRGPGSFSRPGAAVDYTKQKKIVSTALHYIQKKNAYHLMTRFDVIEITVDTINHIEGAFEYSGRLGY